MLAPRTMSRNGPRNRPFRSLASGAPRPPAPATPVATSFAEVAAIEGVAPLPPGDTQRVPPAITDAPAIPIPAPAFVIRDEEGWLDGARADLPRRALRKLHGVPSATLDLHGLDASAARSAVRSFVRDRSRRGSRLVIVIVGRGRHSPGGRGVLRQSIGGWLLELGQHILAFRTAAPELGGDGAVVVLLATRA